ncbi:hypothetical protein [Synechococcus sp. MW101C3]|uniref:hypothetical protein n=1 Tax=Synechococcus sp. MW101C3 TaxID=210768 RepID=UPI0011818DCD|nr:hypothetical protein [Synechococcus sp. MW101C3]
MLGIPPPPPPPPPLDRRLLDGGNATSPTQSNEPQPRLSAGQVQFLKKFLDTPLSREMIEYYSGLEYYRHLVGGNARTFVSQLMSEGLIKPHDTDRATWICSDKGKGVAQSAIIHTRTDSGNIIDYVQSLQASETLKVATELYRDGNVPAAVLVLKEAYKKIENSSVSYGIDTYLRLPSYLQKLGRYDEAWGFLNNLLARGYPNQIQNEALILLARSKIYKAMCRLLQHEGKGRTAIIFGAASIVAEAQYYYLQSEEKDWPKDFRKERAATFRSLSEATSIHEKMKKITKKEITKSQLEDIANYLCSTLLRPKAVKYDRLIVEVDSLICVEKDPRQ